MSPVGHVGEALGALGAARAGTTATREVVTDLLARGGVGSFHLEHQVANVLDHSTPDAVLGALPFVLRSGEYEGQLANVAARAVESGHVDRVTTALDRLAHQGTTGNGLAADVVGIVDHPRFDEIVDLAPQVRRAGTYPHYVIDAARDAIDAGHADRYGQVLRRIVDAGVGDGTIAHDVVGVMAHPRFDDILDLGIQFRRLGGFGHQVFPKAQEVVEAGRLEAVSRAANELVTHDIGNHEMVNQLVELAGNPDLPRIVEVAPTMHRIVPNGYDVIPITQQVLASGHADQVTRIASELADDGIAYQGLAESLIATADHPELDEILRVTRIVRASGAQTHDVQRARAIVEHEHSTDILAAIDAIVDGAGPGRYVSDLALDLVRRGQDLDTIRSTVRASAAAKARLQPDAIKAADLDSLGELLTVIPHGHHVSYQSALEALQAKLRDLRPVDEVDRQLLERVGELVDANHGRVTGALRDGYGRHPDYADLGRIDSTLRLRALRAQAGAAADAGTLSW